MRQLGAAALIAAALIGAAGPAAASNRALVIGVNSYPFLTEDGKPADRDLQGSVPDANRFTEFLTKQWGFSPDSIRRLTDDQATHDGILASFKDWLVDGTAPGDRVVFYYSGHGVQVPDLNGDEGDGDKFDEALAPHDTSGDLRTATFDHVIIDDEIGALLDELPGREVWVVVDACFSGTITRSAAVSPDGRSSTARARSLTPLGPPAVRNRSLATDAALLGAHKTQTRLLSILPDEDTAKPDGSSLFAWSATTSAQLAFESTETGGGVFTAAFIEGLRGKKADFDGNGQVTAAELLTFVRKRSEDFCKNEPQCKNGSGLTPEVIAPKEDFTFVLAPPLFADPAVVKARKEDEEKAQQQAEADKQKEQEKEQVQEETKADETAAPPPEGEAEGEAAGEAPGDAAGTAGGLFAHDNDFDFDIQLLPGTDIALGQEVEFALTSAEPGFLVVFDQGPDGVLRQIYPNEYSLANGKPGLVAAGSTVHIPDPSYGFAFEATEAGDSVLIALVVDAQVTFGDLLEQNKEFDIIGAPDPFMSEIASRLLEADVSPDPDKPNGRHHWAFKTVHYTVH